MYVGVMTGMVRLPLFRVPTVEEEVNDMLIESAAIVGEPVVVIDLLLPLLSMKVASCRVNTYVPDMGVSGAEGTANPDKL
jgi:hypothetical protein